MQPRLLNNLSSINVLGRGCEARSGMFPHALYLSRDHGNSYESMQRIRSLKKCCHHPSPTQHWTFTVRDYFGGIGVPVYTQYIAVLRKPLPGKSRHNLERGRCTFGTIAIEINRKPKVNYWLWLYTSRHSKLTGFCVLQCSRGHLPITRREKQEHHPY